MKELNGVWRIILKSNDEKAKKHFLGDVSKCRQEELLEAFKALQMMLNFI